MAVLILGAPLIKVAFFPGHVVNKTIDMSYGIVDKTLTADNAVYNYEWFKKQYGEIQSAEQQIASTNAVIDSYTARLPDKLSEWTFENNHEYSRLNTIRIGQMNYLISLKNEYNARAKMVNRSIFKDIPESF